MIAPRCEDLLMFVPSCDQHRVLIDHLHTPRHKAQAKFHVGGRFDDIQRALPKMGLMSVVTSRPARVVRASTCDFGGVAG